MNVQKQTRSKQKVSKREKTVAFIVARLSSSRFRAKHFQMIGDKCLLEWTLDGLKRCKSLDAVVIATAAEPENEPLKTFARENGIDGFWYEGDVNHVTTRLCRAAEEYDAEICLLISGDCPLMPSELIDSMVNCLRQNRDADYLRIATNSNETVCGLEGVGIYRERAWQRADRLSDREELKEHHFPLIKQRPDIFTAADFVLPPEYLAPKHRYSIDTQADLDFMREVYGELQRQNRGFSLQEVIKLLQEKPQLRELNAHVHQRALVENVEPVLVAVDAGGEYGYGHLMRCQELALQIVERLSWPVTVLCDDPLAIEKLESSGLRVLPGAIGREGLGDFPAYANIRVSEYSLCVLDLARRPVRENWRSELPPKTKVVALDSCAEWTQKADMVIIPGIAGVESPERRTVFGGIERVILRRAVRRMMVERCEKDIDMLCYANNHERQIRIGKLAEESGWVVKIVTGHTRNFPELLSRSKVFLGNYGYSFYEALVLGCKLVAWPLTEQHRADAEVFFRRMSLPKRIVSNEVEIMTVVRMALLDTTEQETVVEDGTRRVVADIAALLGRKVQA